MRFNKLNSITHCKDCFINNGEIICGVLTSTPIPTNTPTPIPTTAQCEASLVWNNGLYDCTIDALPHNTGNANCDDSINTADMSIWLYVMGSGTYTPNADFNQDGRVNKADISRWLNNYSQ